MTEVPEFTLRTLKEIDTEFTRLNEHSGTEDMMGFRRDVLATFLIECYKDEHKDKVPNLTYPYVIQEMTNYLEFAFGKAEDHRGLSAGRSVMKLQSWMWILGDDEASAFADDDDNYQCYGVPILKYLGKRYGIRIPEEIANWTDGEPCIPDCAEGCL